MATELAKAYVQIVPSAKGIENSISKELGGEANSAGASAGSRIVSGIKKAIATAAIGKAIASTITEGAELEQSIGGIETLFKESAGKVKEYAANAYRTAGMSANEYMQLTTSFSASLLQSLAGDTQKAADVSNMAMTDMSDNANKMGTSMEDIKNAYQGFAKQNYTMLDNLKLGYGGTKTEMERLLADAQKISGVKYDINNLSDVYNAIHVIQGELDITGTTAKEAASTLSGSFDSMKAAFKNVIGQITLGMDIKPALRDLAETTTTYLFGNLLPAVGNILTGIPDMLEGVGTIIVRSMNIAANNADQITQQGTEFVSQLATAIISNAPYLIEAAWNLLTSFGSAILNTDWISVGEGMINNIQSGLSVAAGEILGSDSNIVDSILNSIRENLPKVLDSGSEIITNLANGILQNIPSIITMAGTIILELISGITPMIPMILESGAQILLNLVNGIISNLPEIAEAAVSVISNFGSYISSNLPYILQTGIEIIGNLGAGLILAIPDLVSKIPQIISSIKSTFSNANWGEIGSNIIKGISNGIKNAAGQLWEAAKSVLGDFKDKILEMFGIHSPSTWGEWVAEMIDVGMAKSIVKNSKIVLDAGKSLVGLTKSAIESEIEITNSRAKIAYTLQKETGMQGSTLKKEETIDELKNYIRELPEIIQMVAYLYIDGKYAAKAMAKPMMGEMNEYNKFKSMLEGEKA